MITQTEIVNKMIAQNGTPTMASIIKDLIEEHDTREMETGVNYFYNQNAILNREITYIQDGVEVVDKTATNNRLPHNWHKLLVKQKMGYLVGKPISFSDSEASAGEDGEEKSPNEEFINLINDTLGEDFDDAMNELVKGSSNKGVEWLHIYIDEEGQFGYAIIDARQIIPIWETQRQEVLEGIIRYYEMLVNGERRIRAEYWTGQNVTYYLEDAQGEYILDHTVEKNPQSHFYNVKEVGEEQIETGLGWGMVPFIPFKNNEEMINDLNDYKALIDEYDKNRSDLANNLEEIQDVIWVLKNYQGQSLAEFQKNLRYYKALKVDGDGGADKITIDIPVEAKKEHTDRLTEDIFLFGQGVNVLTDRFGNSPSGVALQFLYAQLDLKCDVVERKFKKAIRKLLQFIAKYIQLTEKKEYNYKAVDITFNRSMIINESEKIDSAQKSKGIVDDETIVSNHPWVDDPQKTLERLEAQKTDIYGDRLAQDLANLDEEIAGVEL